MLNNIYDKRSVEVKDIVGTVYIESESTGYIKKFMSGESNYGYGYSDLSVESLMVKNVVKDRMRVEVV